MSRKLETFYQKARSWAAKQNLHGASAFSRFVMMTFVDRLNHVSDEFIFKGGNLLWVYIKTSRPTVDVDLVTRSTKDHPTVKKLLDAVCNAQSNQIAFSVREFRPMDTNGLKAAAVVIGFRTSEGQENSFDLDIVYAIPTISTRISSTLDDGHDIAAVTMENIIVDKIDACHRFGSGNTRMKDFDDLWRISKSDAGKIDWPTLKKTLEVRGVMGQLEPSWLNDSMGQIWANYLRRHKGLPANLNQLVDEVNFWLNQGFQKIVTIEIT